MGSDTNWTNVLSSLIGAAGTAYASYNLSSSGITPLKGGNYALQTPTGTQILANPTSATNMNSILIFGAIVLVGFFAFNAMK